MKSKQCNQIQGVLFKKNDMYVVVFWSLLQREMCIWKIPVKLLKNWIFFTWTFLVSSIDIVL